MSFHVLQGYTVVDHAPKTKQSDSRIKLTCACSRCDEVMELQIAIDRFGDRPAYKIFRCDYCGAVEWMPM